MTPRRFREQMDYLASEGYRVVNILEAVQAAPRRTIPPRTVGLNFDDGFLDVAENALARARGARLSGHGVRLDRGHRRTVHVPVVHAAGRAC